MGNVLTNSKVAQDARLFHNVRCINSEINAKCTIGDDCDIDGLVMYEKSELGRRNLIRNTTIEKGSYTGTNTIVKKTDIGRYCCISWNVSIGGGNHDYKKTSLYTDYWFKRTFGVEAKETPVDYRTTIGNDVWIGAGVNIIGGVTIGDGCVIGAGSVVTHDIEPYSIVVGVPGRVIKKRFDEETIDKLKSLQWWNWSEEKIKENIEFLRGEPNFDLLRNL